MPLNSFGSFVWGNLAARDESIFWQWKNGWIITPLELELEEVANLVDWVVGVELEDQDKEDFDVEEDDEAGGM